MSSFYTQLSNIDKPHFPECRTHFVAILLILILPLLSSTFFLPPFHHNLYCSVCASFIPHLPSYSAQKKYTLPLLPLRIKMVTKHPQQNLTFTVCQSERIFLNFSSLKGCLQCRLLGNMLLQQAASKAQNFLAGFLLCFLKRIVINKQCSMRN